MSKFGELLDEKTPILLAFYQQEESGMIDIDRILKAVAAALGDKGKVIKIDVDKNQKLSEALRVRVLPTFIIYKFSEMVWSCLLYTSPSPRDRTRSRMPSSA